MGTIVISPDGKIALVDLEGKEELTDVSILLSLDDLKKVFPRSHSDNLEVLFLRMKANLEKDRLSDPIAFSPDEREFLISPIDAHPFGARSYGAFRRIKIDLIWEVLTYAQERLLSLGNFGQGTLEEVMLIVSSGLPSMKNYDELAERVEALKKQALVMPIEDFQDYTFQDALNKIKQGFKDALLFEKKDMTFLFDLTKRASSEQEKNYFLSDEEVFRRNMERYGGLKIRRTERRKGIVSFYHSLYEVQLLAKKAVGSWIAENL